jgi:hypothetical protein
MKQAKALPGLLIALIATSTLLGCDSRLRRPWEPTTPQKTLRLAFTTPRTGAIGLQTARHHRVREL